jgi:hypothetical protein
MKNLNRMFKFKAQETMAKIYKFWRPKKIKLSEARSLPALHL